MKKLFLLIILNTIAFAGNPFDIRENFLNETNADKWTDPTSGVTFHSGPNYEYRFKDDTATVAPWLQLQLPSARIGCNGLSVKGGFLALLGLDDIKLQLENAGPTFAWGVLTTIEISLPSVAAIFQKIQQWARKIQELLQNSCNTGQQAGRWLNKSYGFGNFEGSIIDKGADKIKGAMESVEKTLDEITTLSDENNSTKQAVASDKLHKVGSGLSFMATHFGQALGQCSTEPELAGKNKIVFTAEQILNGTVEGCNLRAKMSPDEFDRNVLSYMLTRALFGELVITPASLTPIEELFKADGTFDSEATKRELKSVIARAETPYDKIEYSVYPAVIGDPKKAANFLIRGNRDASGNALSISIPNLSTMYIKFQYADASNDNLVNDINGSISGSNAIFSSSNASSSPEKYDVRAIYTTRPQSGSAVITEPLKWDGLIEESKSNILAYLNNALKSKIGTDRANNLFGDISHSAPTAILKTPLLVNGIQRYLNILTQEAIEKGGVYTVMPLVDMLATYNAELFAQQLLSKIMQQIESSESGPNVTTTEHTRKGFTDFKKRVLTIYGVMQEELREMKKETVLDTQKVPAIFDEIETKMKQKRVEQLRGQ